MPKVGLVTVLYNSEDVLEGFFKSIAQQTFKDYHLYLIDNKPSIQCDKLINNLLIKYPVNACTHIKNPENYGVAKGNNQGIELSLKDNNDYVLLLNNDIEFYQADVFEQMVNCAKDGENLIIPKILYYNTRTIWMAGGRLIKSKGYTIHIGEDSEDSGNYNFNTYFDYAPTCFMLINANVFKSVGLMDERYFVYFDDTDFIFRATKKRFKIYYMSNLEVFHKVSSSTGGYETLFSIYYVNRNRIYFIRKNLKGVYKLLALSYTFSSRLYKLVIYNKEQRGRLISGFKDALKMS